MNNVSIFTISLGSLLLCSTFACSASTGPVDGTLPTGDTPFEAPSGGSGATGDSSGQVSGETGGVANVAFRESRQPALSACATCESLRCAAVTSACAPGTSCDALKMCLASCKPGDAACATTCEHDSPDGLAALNAERICVEYNCSAECR